METNNTDINSNPIPIEISVNLSVDKDTHKIEGLDSVIEQVEELKKKYGNLDFGIHIESDWF